MSNQFRKKKQPYKDPVFLFTSCSLRFAAWAGWYSAFGEIEETQQFVHQAHTEWVKELGASRRFDFLGYHNSDIWKYISEEKTKEIINKFFKEIKAEIKKGKVKDMN